MKLLATSVGGTHRSSTQKSWTLSHGKRVAASFWNINFGVVPPDTANVANCWPERTSSSRSTM